MASVIRSQCTEIVRNSTYLQRYNERRIPLRCDIFSEKEEWKVPGVSPLVMLISILT